MPALRACRRGTAAVCPDTPINPRRTRPCLINSLSTNCAVLLATAKQMPCAPMMTAVLMPITSPREDTSGPPELPGFKAASVWITSSIRRPLRDRNERPSAEMTPAVTVDSKPSGLPMATTSWPRLSALESPSTACARSRAEPARSSAKSVSGSSPSRRASMRRPSASSRRTSLAPATTWLLVSTSPSGAITTPEPTPPGRPLAPRVSTRTTAGPTASATVITALE